MSIGFFQFLVDTILKELDFCHFFNQFEQLNDFSEFPNTLDSFFKIFIAKLSELIVTVVRGPFELLADERPLPAILFEKRLEFVDFLFGPFTLSIETVKVTFEILVTTFR